MKNNNELEWLMRKAENNLDRYIEAENFIIEIANMRWYQRLFLNKKIIEFLNSRNKFN